MEKSIQTLPAYYVCINERPKHAVNIPMRKKQNEPESLPQINVINTSKNKGAKTFRLPKQK